MEEEISLLLETAEESMSNAVAHTVKALNKIRTGRATPALLDSVKVECYGMTMPINQVATVTASDASMLVVTPFDKGTINAVDNAIRNSGLGFNPSNDGNVVRVMLPALTEDRRKELARQAKDETENGKITVRGARKDTNEELKKLLKDGASEDMIKGAEADVQALTDKFTKKMDDLFASKEKDLMKI